MNASRKKQDGKTKERPRRNHPVAQKNFQRHGVVSSQEYIVTGKRHGTDTR